jgi:hypothetical protein
MFQKIGHLGWQSPVIDRFLAMSRISFKIRSLPRARILFAIASMVATMPLVFIISSSSWLKVPSVYSFAMM